MIQLEGLGIDYIDRRNALVEAVTLDDARRAAQRLFGAGKPFVVAVGKPEGFDRGSGAAGILPRSFF